EGFGQLAAAEGVYEDRIVRLLGLPHVFDSVPDMDVKPGSPPVRAVVGHDAEEAFRDFYDDGIDLHHVDPGAEQARPQCLRQAPRAEPYDQNAPQRPSVAEREEHLLHVGRGQEERRAEVPLTLRDFVYSQLDYGALFDDFDVVAEAGRSRPKELIT